MTTYQPAAGHVCSCAPSMSHRPRWWMVLAAQVAAVAVYVLAVPVGGVDLAARTGSTTRTIHVSMILGAVLVVGLASVSLSLALRRFTARPDRNWAVAAAVATVLSLTGPAGATNLAAGLALACMHLVVAGTFALGSLPWHRARSGRL